MLENEIETKKEKNDAYDVVKRVLSNGKKHRRQFDKGWIEEDELYHGKAWRDTDGYRPFENHVFEVIEGEVPILTDNYPQPTVKTKDLELKEQAESLKKAMKWVLQDQSFDLMLPMVVRSSLISAPGYIHTYYDPNGDNGDGQIVLEQVDWKKVYINGTAKFIENAKEVRIELSREKDWLIANYPEHEEKIKKKTAENEIQGSKEGRETQDTGNNYAQRNVPKEYKDSETLCLVKTFKKDFSLTNFTQEEIAEELQEESLQGEFELDARKFQPHKEHLEMHLSDLASIYNQFGLEPSVGFDMLMQAAEQLSEQNPEADLQPLLTQAKILESHIKEHEILMQENPEGKKLKYKNALRCIESIDDLILYDDSSKDDHCKIPLTVFYCYRDGSVYGHGEVRHIKDSQRMSAVMLYKEYKGLQRVANPEKIVDEETGLTEDDISNEDGAIYVIPQGTNIRDIPPGQVSNQLPNFSESRKQSMKSISGVTEATQGQIPHPNASGFAIDKLQQQAIGRLRLKSRGFERYSIKGLGQLIASNIVQYWTNEKTFELDDGQGNLEENIYNPIEIQDLVYSVDIDSENMSGIDKDAFNSLLFNFLNGGHITFAEFLETAEIPRSKQLLNKVEERGNLESQLQETQRELIKLKGSVNPNLLTPEEAELYDQIQMEEMQQQMGANNGQPIA